MRLPQSSPTVHHAWAHRGGFWVSPSRARRETVVWMDSASFCSSSSSLWCSISRTDSTTPPTPWPPRLPLARSSRRLPCSSRPCSTSSVPSSPRRWRARCRRASSGRVTTAWRSRRRSSSPDSSAPCSGTSRPGTSVSRRARPTRCSAASSERPSSGPASERSTGRPCSAKSSYRLSSRRSWPVSWRYSRHSPPTPVDRHPHLLTCSCIDINRYGYGRLRRRPYPSACQRRRNCSTPPRSRRWRPAGRAPRGARQR